MGWQIKMNTEFLIQMLARQAGPAPTYEVAKSLWWPVAVGFIVSLFLAISMIGILPVAGFLTSATFIKFLYASALVVALGVLVARACKPGASSKGPLFATLAVTASISLIGLVYFIATPPTLRIQVLFGQTWLACPWAVMGISLPTLGLLFLGANRLAPVHLKTAGFELGLLAGALGALAYAFACPEQSLTFVAIWYTAGIILTGLVGLMLGPKVLRW